MHVQGTSANVSGAPSWGHSFGSLATYLINSFHQLEQNLKLSSSNFKLVEYCSDGALASWHNFKLKYIYIYINTHCSHGYCSS
jgi:hypothetical protein